MEPGALIHQHSLMKNGFFVFLSTPFSHRYCRRNRNLSTSGLNGEIASGIANLTMIDVLDLSNNNLTGTLPDFLSELNFLKVLNLKGNKFIRPVPVALLAKAKQRTLSLSVDDEITGDAASSCDRNTCENKKNKNVIIPAIILVAFIFLILIALIAIWIVKKQKAHENNDTHTRKYKASLTTSMLLLGEEDLEQFTVGILVIHKLLLKCFYHSSGHLSN